MAGYTNGNYQYDYNISFINIRGEGITRLPCYNVVEVVLGTNKKSDIPVWIPVTVLDLVIYAGCNEWRITNTKKIGDVHMPVELGGFDKHKLLRTETTFNISYFYNSGLMNFSKPTECIFNVLENMAINDQWRTYWEHQESGLDEAESYEVSGLINNVSRVLVIEEASWQVVANQTFVDPGLYTVSGLGAGKKLIVGRKDDGESEAYGNVTPILSN